jgi:hypothetical protein
MANPSVLDQLPKSNLSLQGNGFNPTPGSVTSQNADWGYSYLVPPDLRPDMSELHYNRSLPRTLIRTGYSVDGGDYLKYAEAIGIGDGSGGGGLPGGVGIGQMLIYDYNRAFYGGFNLVRPPSELDEMDKRAPNNEKIGSPVPTLTNNNVGPVVSQIYKSVDGKRYKDLGPRSGRY